MEPGTATAGQVNNRDGSPGAPVVRKGRPGVIVLIAFVVQLVAIAALANQIVTKHLLDFAATYHDRFVGHLVAAFTTYQWRVSAQPGDRANEPLAHACLILTVLVLTALLVLAVCRGPVTFGRAFFGTWMAVVVSTLVGQVVFDLVSPPPYPHGFGHLAGAVFTGPNGAGFAAGVMLGLVTAVFAAIFAVATRRIVRLPVPAYAEDPRRDQYAGWSDQTVAYPRTDYQQAAYSQGYPQPYQQPYGQPYEQPYSGGYYPGQTGAQAPEAGGEADATQHIQGVPESEQSQASRSNGQPTEATPGPSSEPATGPGSGERPPEDMPANARGDATQQFSLPPDEEDASRHTERYDR